MLENNVFKSGPILCYLGKRFGKIIYNKLYSIMYCPGNTLLSVSSSKACTSRDPFLLLKGASYTLLDATRI